MKKTITIISVSLVIILMLTGFISDYDKPDDTAYKKINPDYVGTWQLSYNNDRGILDETFPDIYAFGSELTIMPGGKIYWHIGAAGAAGTYEAFDNQLTACVADIMEYDEYRMDLTVNEEGRLLMKYKSIPLEWTYCSEAY